MKFISWNVNGLRACVQKGFLDYFRAMEAGRGSEITCIVSGTLAEKEEKNG